MGRRLYSAFLPWALAACGDDVSEAVTGAGTESDVTTTDDSSDDFPDTFETLDATSDPTLTTFDTQDVDSDTFDTSDVDSDTFDTQDVDSDTFDTSDVDSDSDSFDTSEVDSDSDSDSLDTSEVDSDSDSDSDPTTTDPTDTDPTTTTDPTDTDPTDTDPTTTTDPTDTDPTDTDPTATDPTDTDSDSDTDTGGGFSDPPPFGSNVLDLDLVGVWGLNWDQPAGFDSVIQIDDMGNFTWTETSADCADSTVASGFLWVQGSQVVMHVEVWDRQLPWDTMPVLGESFEPPFRLSMSFSLQGGGVDSYLALAAPSRITEAAPYTGESYVRLASEGAFIAGDYHGESQLEAIPDGETDPVVILIERYDADLGLELAPDDPQGFGLRSVTTQYFPVPQQDEVYDGANWTCLGGCPQPSGTTLVDGANLYTYGPYGGQTHLLTFASGRTFRSGYASDCD